MLQLDRRNCSTKCVAAVTMNKLMFLVTMMAGASSAAPTLLELLPILSKAAGPAIGLDSIITNHIHSKLRALHPIPPPPPHKVVIVHHLRPKPLAPVPVPITTSTTPNPTTAQTVIPVVPLKTSESSDEFNIHSLHTSESSGQSFSVSLPLAAPTVDASASSIGSLTYGPPSEANKPSATVVNDDLDTRVYDIDPRAPSGLRVLALDSESGINN